jgi:hypothetical protein
MLIVLVMSGLFYTFPLLLSPLSPSHSHSLPLLSTTTTTTSPLPHPISHHPPHPTPPHPQALRQRLDVTDALPTAPSKGAKTKPKKGTDAVTIAGPRTGGLHLISTLALTHAHLSRASVDTLERVLQLGAPTLTGEWR